MSPALHTLHTSPGASTLILMLPGAYMTPDDYRRAGFGDALVRHGIAADLQTLALDLATVTEGESLPARIGEVLAAARPRYARIWLGGISLGGLISLCHAADHPGCVDGLCLLAPYPGSRLTTNAIARAGGLEVWQPSGRELNDPEFRMWHWLQAPPPDLPVFVGYGSDDRFAASMAQIAGCFPASSRCVVPGRHDWPAWQTLWEHFLTRGDLSA